MILSTPLGQLLITSSERGITAIIFTEETTFDTSTELEKQAATQLNEYFTGTRKTFDFPLDLQGTDFQKRVWQELLTVPFGATSSYLNLSRTLGDEKAIRAVAAANGKNPIAIVVPCHRIIGSDGSLTGYAGGLWRKEWLLRHESKTEGMLLF